MHKKRLKKRKKRYEKIIISSICAFLGAICIIGLLRLLWNIKIGQRGDEFGRVMSIEEICTRINYAGRNIHERCLAYNYKKQCTDFYNIDLTRNNIANRTTSSWYEEQYECVGNFFRSLPDTIVRACTHHSSLYFRSGAMRQRAKMAVH